ncbi:MAG TPA: hypothetical protein VJ302_08965 [Blastocatellia bacterium]|nr:hypothetical protein [Blastocatellia bacterium]
MSEPEIELAHFFAWARARAYREFERRIQTDATLDPNWTFSDVMQELLEEYRQIHQVRRDPAPDERVER